MVPVFAGHVDASARLGLLDAEKGKRRAYLITLAGEDVEIVIRKPRKKRSNKQLRYWFGVPMTLLSGKTGYTKMQMHYLCLALCFGVVNDAATGREIPVVPASKHLTTKHFAELIEWVGPWAFETYDGLQIPLPNEIDIDSLPGEDESEAAA